MDNDATNEDDLTCKLSSIVTISNTIREQMAKGNPYDVIMMTWDTLNLEVAQVSNNSVFKKCPFHHLWVNTMDRHSINYSTQKQNL